MSEFINIFPNQRFTTANAFESGVVKALEVLRQIDLAWHHPHYEMMTYPGNGQNYIYRVASALAVIQGANDQQLPIARGQWQGDGFSLVNSGSGVEMQVEMMVARWGKQQRDVLRGLFVASCLHTDTWGSLGYAISASIAWDGESKEKVQKRTDGSHNIWQFDQGVSGRTHKLLRPHSDYSSADGDGRYDSEDKI